MTVNVKGRNIEVDENLINIYRDAYGEYPEEGFYLSWMRRKTGDDEIEKHLDRYSTAHLSEMANDYLKAEAEILG
jgi:hypothetical protein